MCRNAFELKKEISNAMELSAGGSRRCAATRLPGLNSFRRRRTLSGLLALVLPILRLSRALAQEDSDVGYRREFYREDNNRIRVDTDSFRFDVGLRSNVRLNGDVVMDAISGATPLGAPPQVKWPFPTYGDLYKSAYHQAYTSQFN